MRAVGASGKWLASGLFAEAILLSVACTAIGLAIGVLVSWALSRFISSVGNLPVGVISVEAWQIAAAAASGIVAGLIGAARATVRVLTLPLMVGLVDVGVGNTGTWRGRVSRKSVALTTGALAAGTAMLGFSTVIGWLAGFLVLIVGAALCGPLMVRAVAGRMSTLRWPVGLAAARLGRQGALASTAAITASIVCLGAALSVGVYVISVAMETQLSRQFGADVQVSTSVPVESSGVSVTTGYEMKQRGNAQLSQYAGSVFGVVLLALILGSLGAAGVLALSILRREKEIGLFRAVGVHKRTVRWMILGETGIVAVIASVSGLLVGVIAGALLTKVISASLGVTLGFVVSPVMFAVILAIALGSLLVAAYLPSRRASRVEPIVVLTSV